MPKCVWRAPTLQQLGSCLRAPVFFPLWPRKLLPSNFSVLVKSPSEGAFTGRVCASRTSVAFKVPRLLPFSNFRKFWGRRSSRRCSDSSLTNQTFSRQSEGACLKSGTTEAEVLLNNGRILFTFIARLPARLKRVSARSQSFSADSGSVSLSNFKKLLHVNFHRSQHLRDQTSPYLVSGRDAAQPNPGLIHSLAAPGGLLAPSCPLFLLPCHQITFQLSQASQIPTLTHFFPLRRR